MSHDIDAEEVMGMFSAIKEKAPNAKLWYLSSKMRAKKNNVVDYLDRMDTEKQDSHINWSIQYARKRCQNRRKQSEILQEMSHRSAEKCQNVEKDRRAVEKKISRIKDAHSFENVFPNLESKDIQDLSDILFGSAVGCNIRHVWYDANLNDQVTYSGRIGKLKRNKKDYEVAYWSKEETFNDAVDYKMSRLALAADLVCGDLIMS